MATKKRKTTTSGTPTTLNADRKRKMVTITFDPDLIDRVDRLAKRLTTTRSRLIESAVLAYLASR